MTGELNGERRSSEPHHLEAFDKTHAFKEEALDEWRADDKVRRRQAAPWILVALISAAMFGAVAILNFDTRQVAVTSSRCTQGDEAFCRASANRIAQACSPQSIARDPTPALALQQCRNLARALEPLQVMP